MKKKILFFACLILCGCSERGCQKWQRQHETGERNYEVKIYSGGQVVFEDRFRGIITQEDGDGAFYYKGDTLIELAGDYIIKSTD